MTISATTKIRDIALELPQATRIFEQLKIDYCCGGHQPLGDACASAGVDVAILPRMLDEAGQADLRRSGSLDPQEATLSELMRHIVEKHHFYTKEQMARLEPLVNKVIEAHGENHKELRDIGGVFQRLCVDLAPHMFKEEQILFPYIRGMEASVLQHRPAPSAPFGTVNNPIRMMMREHETAGELLRELRSLSSDYNVPADACLSYQTLYQELEALEQDLHQHIHLENNILFPRAIELEANN